jgi:fatty-acyl-CoA synthase
MYISGGENVYPAEIEHLLAELPEVLEAAVIGTPDVTWGEVGCAFLLARPGHNIPSDAELTRSLQKHLAPYKIPKRYIHVDDFPRTGAGKIQKHLLQEK